jgi:DNA-directed RNA polymerase specialized sigma24 family protein
MADDTAFLELIQQVRAGEEAAACEIVRRYENALLREIRIRLRDPRLRRSLDSVDICQSVLASFFLRASAGQYQLLVAMARNKLASQARLCYVTRRDPDALRAGLSGGESLQSPAPDPGQAVATREFCGALLSSLSDEERQLVDRRARSEGWAEIAAEMGGNPENLRKKLARALERAARRLGEE